MLDIRFFLVPLDFSIDFINLVIGKDRILVQDLRILVPFVNSLKVIFVLDFIIFFSPI